MSKFEAFLITVLKAVFKDYQYNKEIAKNSFEKVKSGTTNTITGGNNGNRK